MSKRLKAIENYIFDGSILVDVGTDHGFLMIDAIINKGVKHAYGIDINENPLLACQSNVDAAGLNDQVTLILGDGLKDFNEQADVFVLAGMGGETIYKILADYHFKEGQRIIIQANSKHIELREALVSQGLAIIAEEFFLEKEIPILIMVAEVGTTDYTDVDFVVGPQLKTQSNRDYQAFLNERLAQLETIKNYSERLKREYDTIKQYLQGGVV